MLELYGHPFSSYTWKAQIALHAIGAEHELCILDEDHAENRRFVERHGGPWARFPVLNDDGAVIFEATSIIEWLNLHHPGRHPLIPEGTEAAIRTRMFDRVFDNYVMAPTQAVVNEYLRNADNPAPDRVTEARDNLLRSYAWLERWRETYAPEHAGITLIECAAAPALFYADWVEPIPQKCQLLRQWRAQLLSLEPVAHCVEAARPYRPLFPLGAPGRD